MRYYEYVCELCGGCSSVVERLVVVQDVVGSIPISRPIYSFTNIHLRSRMFTMPLFGFLDGISSHHPSNFDIT